MNDLIEGYRLSPQQERDLEFQQDNPAYRTQCAVSIDGPLRTEALRAALQSVVAKHEILRTSYRLLPGLEFVVQVIADYTQIPLQELDISSLDSSEQNAQVQKFVDEEMIRAFDLGQGPVLHATVLILAPAKHVLVIAFPSVCADTWSTKNILNELAYAYVAQTRGESPSSDGVLQYADFAEWRNTLLEGDEGRQGAAYWAQLELKDKSPVRLPFERDPGGSGPVKCVPVGIDGAAARVEALARRSGVASSDVLLACWQTLLWRMAGQPDELRIDVHFDGRKYEYLHHALGCFGQNLPIVCRLHGEMLFANLVTQCQRAKSDAHRFQEFFDFKSSAERGGRPNAHRFGFSYEEWPTIPAAGDLTFETINFFRCSDNVKLELVCMQRAQALAIELRYDPTVYSNSGIEQLGEAFQVLLGGVTRDPHAAIGRLPIVSDRMQCVLLKQWNSTPSENVDRRCIHEMFEQQVERTPDAIAVCYEEERLTYRALNVRANQLARHLRRIDVGPDRVVGLVLDRSVEMVIAVLAVLKAGAAYLPLEATLPKMRLSNFLQDACPAVVVAHKHLLHVLPDHNAGVVCLEDERDALAELSGSNFASGATGANLAYVIFTSGSSGKPKGVAVEHRQLVNYVSAAIERLDFSDVVSFATVSTLAADLGNTAIFPALVLGGALHIISRERASDASALAAYLSDRPVDCLKIVPSHFAALVEGSPHPEKVFPRKRLVLGGETLTWGRMRVFQSHAPVCQIFNHYGPTETTVGVAACDAKLQSDSNLSKSVPLGVPLINTQIYLLDTHLQPVPIGVAGEICISGANVARGYINRPELTAERFIPNPFADAPGSRLYRTGDLGRHLPDGTIELLGRIDRQVKLRGYRVEPGEIEALLRQHPGVREGIVALSGEAAEHLRIVAYVVTDDADTVTVARLNTYLAERLPDYMVPSAIVFLDKLPLTPNGKIDYRALPAPEQISAPLSDAYAVPRTDIEQIVAGIFATLLGSSRVGIHDDFFEIGGHSLLATRLLSRTRDVFKAEISLRSVFEEPTIAGLGAAIEAALLGDSKGAAGSQRRNSDQQPLPLSLAQKSIWDPIRHTSGRPPATIDFLLWLAGELDIPGLEHALRELLARHEILRATFAGLGEELVQVLSDAMPVTLAVEEIAMVDGGFSEVAVIEWARALARQPFDLAKGPLLRTHLLRVQPDEHVLLLNIHPLVADFSSGRILLHDVAELYAAWCAKEPCRLASPAAQYADFTAWQSQPTCGEELERQLAYWRQRLDGAPVRLNPPLDGPRRSVQDIGIDRKSFVIGPELTSELKEVSARHAVTLSITLLAAWQVLLSNAIGQGDIVVAFATNGRQRIGAQDVVGPCSGMVLIRSDVSDDPAFGEHLERVRDAVLGAYANQDVPFQTVVQTLGRHGPLAHGMLSVTQSRSGEATFGNARLGRVLELQRQDETEDLDLVLRVVETSRGLECDLDHRRTGDPAHELIVDNWHRLLGRIRSKQETNLYAPSFRLSGLAAPAQ